jgi:(p)ppGpp synthase/HD superfamily hydrolase
MDKARFTVRAASRMAWNAHAGQTDKAGKPYFEHVARVRDALREHGEEAQIAGVLHDILEDTAITEDDLRAAGVTEHTITAILSVTRRPGETYMDLIERAAADPLGRLVKLADNADNSQEDRLAYLPFGQADFLRRRYARARAVLEAAAAESS